MARPLNTAPGTWAPTCASVETAAGTVGFQPVIQPDSDAKMNFAGPEAPPPVTVKSVADGLNTCPVGAPHGMLTVSGTFTADGGLVAPRYSVVLSEPLFETQTGVAVA